jgi:tRNA 2-thiocytidine biosynthesis protein TtcA
MLNLFYTGQLKAMPPKLRSDDGRNVVIRPLAYCEERDLAEYARIRAFPIIPCNLCGSQENLKRVEVKRLLQEWEKRCPGRIENMLHSLRHVRTSHLLDRDAFDFQVLPPSRAGKAKPPQPAADDETTFAHSDVFERPFAEE